MSLFPASVRHAALMRQSFVGADSVRIAVCNGEGCEKHIARLSANGAWAKLIPFDFDHIDEQAHEPDHSLKNCQGLCSGPDSCHQAKTSAFVTMNAKATRQGGGPGSQTFRRNVRKAKGERPLIPQNKNAWGKR